MAKNNGNEIDINKLGIAPVNMKTDEATHAKSFAGSTQEQEAAAKKYGNARILAMSKAGEFLEGLSGDQLLAFKITLDTLEKGTDEYIALSKSINEIEKKLSNFKDFDKLINVYQKYEKTLGGQLKKAEQVEKKIAKFQTAKANMSPSAASFGTAFHGLTESYDTKGIVKKHYKEYGESGYKEASMRIVKAAKSGKLPEFTELLDSTGDVDRRVLKEILDAAIHPEGKGGQRTKSILENRIFKKGELGKLATGKTPLRAYLETEEARKDPKFAGLYSGGRIDEERLSFAEKKMDEYRRLKPSGKPSVERETGLAIKDPARGGYALLGGIMDRFWETIEQADKSAVGGGKRGSRIMDIKTGGIYKHYGMQPNLYGLSEAARTGEMPEEMSLMAIPKNPTESTRMHNVKVASAETVRDAALDAYRIYDDAASLDERLKSGAILSPQELQSIREQAAKIYAESEATKKKDYLSEMGIQTSLERSEVPFTDKEGNPIYQTKKIHHVEQSPLMKKVPLWKRGKNGEKIQILDEAGNPKYGEVVQTDAMGRPIMDPSTRREWDEEVALTDEQGNKIAKTWTDTKLNGRSIYGRSGWNTDTLTEAIMNLPEDQRDAFIAQTVFGTADFNEQTGSYDQRESGYHMGQGVSKGNAQMWDEVRKKLYESGALDTMSKDWQYTAPSEQFKYGRFAFDESYHQATNSPWQELGYGQSISKDERDTKDIYEKTVEEIEKDKLETDEEQAKLHKEATDYSMDPEQIAARMMRLVDLADRIDAVFNKLYDSDLFKENYGEVKPEDRQRLTAQYLQSMDPDMLQDYQFSQYLQSRGELTPELESRDYVSNLASVLSKANMEGWATPEAENVFRSVEQLAKFDQSWMDKLSENFSVNEMGNLSSYKEQDLIKKLSAGRGLGIRFSNMEAPEHLTAGGDLVYQAENIEELDSKFVDVLGDIIKLRRLDLYIADKMHDDQKNKQKQIEDELKNITGLEPPPESIEANIPQYGGGEEDATLKRQEEINRRAEEAQEDIDEINRHIQETAEDTAEIEDATLKHQEEQIKRSEKTKDAADEINKAMDEANKTQGGSYSSSGSFGGSGGSSFSGGNKWQKTAAGAGNGDTYAHAQGAAGTHIVITSGDPNKIAEAIAEKQSDIDWRDAIGDRKEREEAHYGTRRTGGNKKTRTPVGNGGDSNLTTDDGLLNVENRSNYEVDKKTRGRLKSYTTNAQGEVIGETYDLKGPRQQVDWAGEGSFQKWYDKYGGKLNEADLKKAITGNLTTIDTYRNASGALNASGQKELERLLSQAGIKTGKEQQLANIDQNLQKIADSFPFTIDIKTAAVAEAEAKTGNGKVVGGTGRKGSGGGGGKKKGDGGDDGKGGKGGKGGQGGGRGNGLLDRAPKLLGLHRILAKLRQMLQKIWNLIKELDKAATNIRIVTGKNAQEVDNLMMSYNKLAKQLGTTTVAVAQASNTWLRQGYDIAQVSKLIESSTKLSKLGMIDMNNATKVLTSTLKGFHLGASDAIKVVDKFTKLDTKFAASAGEIGEAISRTASVAQQASMTLDETAAAVTTIMDVTQQSAEMAGTALRTMLARYGNVKAGSFAEGEGDEVENLNDIEKVLGKIGVKIRSSNSDMRSYSEVLEDINEKWLYLTDVEKNAVATAMAGVRQRNSFITLMSNYNTYKSALATAQESEGTANQKYEAYLDSIEAHLQQLSTAWEKLAMAVKDSKMIKGIIDFATYLVDNLPKIIGFVSTLLVMLNAYKLPIWIGQLKSGFTGWGTKFKNSFTQEGQAQNAQAYQQKIQNKKLKRLGGKQEGGVGKDTEVEQNTQALRELTQALNNYKDKNTAAQEQEAQASEKLTAAKEQEITATDAETQATNKNTVAENKNTIADNKNTIADNKNTLAENKNTLADNQEAQSSIKAANADDQEAQSSTNAANSTTAKGGGGIGMGIGMGAMMAITATASAVAAGNQNFSDSWSMGAQKNTKSKLSDLEATNEDRLVEGLVVGNSAAGGLAAGAAIGSAIPGLGTAIGAMAGAALGAAVGVIQASIIKAEMHAEELRRKDRVDAALKVIDAIDGLKDPLQTINSSVKDLGSITAENLTKLKDAVDTFKQNLIADVEGNLYNAYTEAFEKAFGDNDKYAGYTVSDFMELLYKGTEEEAKKVNSILQEETLRVKADQTYKSQENDRFTLGTVISNSKYLWQQYTTGNSYGLDPNNEGVDARERIQNWNKYLNALSDEYNTATKKEKEVLGKRIEEVRKQINLLETTDANLKALTKEVDTQAMQAAFYGSQVSQWDIVDVTNKTLEEAIIKIVNEAQENGDLIGIAARDAAGEITDNAREYAMQILRDTAGYEKLFKKDSNILLKLLSTRDDKRSLEKAIGDSFDNILKAVNTNNKDLLNEWATKLPGFGSGDELQSYILALDSMTTETENFARALNVSIKDLDNYKELNRVTLADLDKNIEDLTKNMDELNSVVSNIISNGGVSLKTLSELMKTNTSLLYTYDKDMNVTGIDTSTRNIFTNILNSTMGESKFSTLLANSLTKQIKGDANLYAGFLEYAKGKGADISALKVYSQFTDETIAKINTLEQGNLLQEFLEGINPAEYAEFYLSILDQVSKYETKMIDNSISNLQDQKNAIGDVNKEYEKEISLIKARQGLENAQKEKKKVYRAGVGWTYEADAQKLKEAKQEKERAETELSQENIQYQIDLLEKTKSVINNMPENRQLEQQKELFELWNDSMKTGVQDLSNFLTAMQNAYKGLDELGGKAFEEFKKNFLTNSIAADTFDAFKKSGVDYGKKMSTSINNIEGESAYTKGTEDYSNAIIDYNKTREYLQGTLFNDLGVSTWKNNGIVDNNGNVSVSMFNKAMNTNYSKDDQQYLQGVYDLYNQYGSAEKKQDVSWYATTRPATFLPGNYAYYMPNGNIEYYGITGRDFPDKLGNMPTLRVGENVSLPEGMGDEIIALTNALGTTPTAKMVFKIGNTLYHSKSSAVDGNEWYAYQLAPYGPLVDGGIATTAEWRKNWRKTHVLDENEFAKGTLNSRGGLSLINELGTEGIVTPSGTITSLPAHSGVVPADLTKNLYDLGEVAPNLIKALSTVQTEASHFGATEDNSMYVQNLYTTINADGEFDFRRFLLEAKQYMNLTRNNK